MDAEYTVETFANRDAPIPIINLQQAGDDASSDDGSESGRTLLSPSKAASTTGRTHDASPAGSDTESLASVAGSPPSAGGSSHKRSQSLQDRLLGKCVRCVSETG